MGAIFHVPVEFDVPMDCAAGRFRASPAWTSTGNPIASPAFRKFDCYVFGNEARGLPREQMASGGAKPFTIAGTGAIESLNVAATVNICLYELNRASLTTIYWKLMFSSGTGTAFQAVSQPRASYSKSNTTSCWLFSPTSLACT